MPKLVNYAARFDFLREAAFTVVHDEGVAALSRHSVARALGTWVSTVRRLLATEADLVVLAADEVARRRRHGRYGQLREGEPLARALHVVRALLPDDEHRVAEELVWLRLELARPRGPHAQPELRRRPCRSGGRSQRRDGRTSTPRSEQTPGHRAKQARRETRWRSTRIGGRRR